MTRIAVTGAGNIAGNIGGNTARLLARPGHDVLVGFSTDPTRLRGTVPAGIGTGSTVTEPRAPRCQPAARSRP